MFSVVESGPDEPLVSGAASQGNVLEDVQRVFATGSNLWSRSACFQVEFELLIKCSQIYKMFLIQVK